MKYFQKKHIHSCFASVSSSDTFVSKEISRADYRTTQGEKIYSQKHEIAIVYVAADTHFYDMALAERSNYRPSKEEFAEYVRAHYLSHGWNEEDEYLTSRQAALWQEEEDTRIEKRRKMGFVIPTWSSDLTTEAYQGGFSDAVFNDPYLQNYLNNGGCYGYIGHSARRPQTDIYLERQWLKVNPDTALLAMWLTSSDGRHFADWKEGCPLAEQKTYIKDSIPRLIEQALSYQK